MFWCAWQLIPTTSQAGAVSKFIAQITQREELHRSTLLKMRDRTQKEGYRFIQQASAAIGYAPIANRQALF